MVNNPQRCKRTNEDSFLSQSSGSSDVDEDLPAIPTTSIRNRSRNRTNGTIDRRALRNVATFNQELIEGLLDASPANQELEARERAEALQVLQAQREKKKDKDKGKEREQPPEDEGNASGSSAKHRRVIIESEEEDEDEERDESQEDDQDEDEEVASNLLNSASHTQSRPSSSRIRNTASREDLSSPIKQGMVYSTYEEFSRAAVLEITGLPENQGKERVTDKAVEDGPRVSRVIRCKTKPSCSSYAYAKCEEHGKWRVVTVIPGHSKACPYKTASNASTSSESPRPAINPASHSNAAAPQASVHPLASANLQIQAASSTAPQLSTTSAQAAATSVSGSSQATPSSLISNDAEYKSLAAFIRAAQTGLTDLPLHLAKSWTKTEEFAEDFPYPRRVSVDCRARFCSARAAAKAIEGGTWKVTIANLGHISYCPYKIEAILRSKITTGVVPPENGPTARSPRPNIEYQDRPYARYAQLVVGRTYPTYHHFCGAAIQYLQNVSPQDGQANVDVFESNDAGVFSIKIQCKTERCNAHISTEQPTAEDEWKIVARSLRHLLSCPYKPPKSPPTQYVESFANAEGSSRQPAASSSNNASQPPGSASAPVNNPHNRSQAAPSDLSTPSQPAPIVTLVSNALQNRSNSISVGTVYLNYEEFSLAAFQSLTGSSQKEQGQSRLEETKVAQAGVYDGAAYKCKGEASVACQAEVAATHIRRDIWRVSKVILEHTAACPYAYHADTQNANARPSASGNAQDLFTSPSLPTNGSTEAASTVQNSISAASEPHPTSHAPPAASTSANSQSQGQDSSSSSAVLPFPSIAIPASDPQQNSSREVHNAVRINQVSAGTVFLDYGQFVLAAIKGLTGTPDEEQAQKKVEAVKVAQQAGVYNGVAFRCKGSSCRAQVAATHIPRNSWRVSHVLLEHSATCSYPPDDEFQNAHAEPSTSGNSRSSVAASSSQNGEAREAMTVVPNSVAPAVEAPQLHDTRLAPLPNGHLPMSQPSSAASGSHGIDPGAGSSSASATSSGTLVNGHLHSQTNGASAGSRDEDLPAQASSNRKGKRRPSQQDDEDDTEASGLRTGKNYRSLPKCRKAAFNALDRSASDIDTIRRVVDGVDTVIYKCDFEGCMAHIEADLSSNEWTIKALNLEHIPTCAAAHPETQKGSSASAGEPEQAAKEKEQSASHPRQRWIGSPSLGRKTTRPTKRRRTASPSPEPENAEPEEHGTREALPTGTRFSSYDEFLAASASALSRDPADLIMTSGDVPPNSKWLKLVCKHHNPSSRPYRSGLANHTQQSARNGRASTQSRFQARVSAEIDPSTQEYIVVKARYEHSIECNQAEFESNGLDATEGDEDEDLARAIAASQALAEEKAVNDDLQAIEDMERQTGRKKSLSMTAEDALEATALALSDVFDSGASVRAAMIAALGRPEEDLVVQFEYGQTIMPRYGRMLVRCRRCALILPRYMVDATNLVEEPKEAISGPQCNAVITAKDHYGDWKVVVIQLAHSDACQALNQQRLEEENMQIDPPIAVSTPAVNSEYPQTAVAPPVAGPSTSLLRGEATAQASTVSDAPVAGAAGVERDEPVATTQDTVASPHPEDRTVPATSAYVTTTLERVASSQLAKPITIIEISDSEDEQETQAAVSTGLIRQVKEEPQSPGPTPAQALLSLPPLADRDSPAANLSCQTPPAEANVVHSSVEAATTNPDPANRNTDESPEAALASTADVATVSQAAPTSLPPARPPLRVPSEPLGRSAEVSNIAHNPPESVPHPAFGDSFPDVATFRRCVEAHSASVHLGRYLLWNERLHRLTCVTQGCPYAFGIQPNAGDAIVILARPKHSEDCMRLERPPIVDPDAAASRIAMIEEAPQSPEVARPSPPAIATVPEISVKPEEEDVMLNSISGPEPPVTQPEEEVGEDAPEASTSQPMEAVPSVEGSSGSSRRASVPQQLARQTATPSTTTSKGGRGKRRYAEPPSLSPGSGHKPAPKQYRKDGTPRIPKPGYTFNSAQELEARIKVYSKFINPAANIRNVTKRKDTLSLRCAHQDCNFYFYAENERRQEDGVVVQGILVVESEPRHSQACMGERGEASSPLPASATRKLPPRPSGRASIVSIRDTPGNSDAESSGRASIKRRFPKKRRRTSALDVHAPQQKQADTTTSSRDRSATPVEPPAEDMLETAGCVDEDPTSLSGPTAAVTKASAEQSTVTEPERGETFANTQIFENSVRSHNRACNPESKLLLTVSEDGRVALKCSRNQCTYNFAGKKVSSGPGSPVLVKSTNPFHSAACLGYYNHPGYRYAPKKGEFMESWERFHEMVEAHSEKLNPGAEETAEPGTFRQTLFEDDDDFRTFVTDHSQAKAPGATLTWKVNTKFIACACKYYYAGCRYEFHAARYYDENAKREKLILTDVIREHNEGCQIERSLAGAKLTRQNSSEGPRQTRRRGVQRNGSCLTHLSASGASDSSWQENDNIDSVMVDTSAVANLEPSAAAPAATTTLQPPPRPIQSQVPSPNLASPAQTPPVPDPVPDAPAAYMVETSPPVPAPARIVDENLETIYLPHGVLPILQQFGYHKVSDLSQAGVTNADWPSLLQHLEEIASFSHLEEEGESLLKVDPIAGFIFERRAAAALSLEFVNRYHAQLRPRDPAEEEPLQL